MALLPVLARVPSSDAPLDTFPTDVRLEEIYQSLTIFHVDASIREIVAALGTVPHLVNRRNERTTKIVVLQGALGLHPLLRVET